jgi:hypothetical protein
MRTKRCGPKTRKRVDQSGQRQDAAAADQSLRLDGEGNEGRKRNEPEQAQEQERDELIARRLVVPAPEHQARAMEGGTMRGDERVSSLGDGGETWQMAVESEPESLPGRVAERQETGLGGAGAMPIWSDILHRPPEIGLRDGGMLRRDLLIGPVFDLIARQLLPVAGPIEAEPAIAVIDEQRARAGGGRFRSVGRLISGVLWHDIRDGWRRAYTRRPRLRTTIGQRRPPRLWSGGWPALFPPAGPFDRRVLIR